MQIFLSYNGKSVITSGLSGRCTPLGRKLSEYYIHDPWPLNRKIFSIENSSSRRKSCSIQTSSERLMLHFSQKCRIRSYSSFYGYFLICLFQSSYYLCDFLAYVIDLFAISYILVIVYGQCDFRTNDIYKLVTPRGVRMYSFMQT